MLSLLLLFAAAAQPAAQLVPVSVQVDGKQFCAQAYFQASSPQVGLDIGREYAADQGSLQLAIDGQNTAAANLPSPYGLVLISSEASAAMSLGQPVTFRYTVHSGKDTVTVTFPSAAATVCK
jgi:hypothetical protein